MSLVLCKLPKAGLGNQLFPLMKAYAFAHLNNLPLIITDYHQIKLGPYIRGDKSKRKYNKNFIFQKNILQDQINKIKLFPFRKRQTQNEPEVVFINFNESENKLFTFSEIPHWTNYFDQLKANRKLVLQLFWKLISPGILKNLSECETPIIGVHIRKGDFRKLEEGEVFSKVGAVRTPENYFIDIISDLRKIHKVDLPVSIFTDGHKEEFGKLLSLKNIKIVEGNKDLVDLLLLSKSKIIVCSAGSTFSYWAGFLSDSPIIMHPDHIHSRLRSEEQLFEGTIQEYMKEFD